MEECFTAYSELSEKCKNCTLASDCENKQKELVGVLHPCISDASSSLCQALTSNALAHHEYRDIKVAENTTITIDLVDIKKEISNRIYRDLKR